MGQFLISRVEFSITAVFTEYFITKLHKTITVLPIGKYCGITGTLRLRHGSTTTALVYSATLEETKHILSKKIWGQWFRS